MSWFRLRAWGIVASVTLSLFTPAWADDDTVVFAVVSDVPKDRSRVSAKALLDGAVSDLKLLPGDTILGNPVWRTLEVCHALKLEGMKMEMDSRSARHGFSMPVCCRWRCRAMPEIA
jgi:hypothetical protein